MILSDQEILQAHKDGEFLCWPWNSANVQPASIDVTLATDFLFMNHEVGFIDVMEPKGIEMLYRPIRSTHVLLHPGCFVLATTEEVIHLGHNSQGEYTLVAKLEGRSSLARLGVQIHATGGFIDPGFRGQITLEMTNMSPVPVRLHAGMRIAQLALMRCGPVAHPYQGKYMNQSGATPSAIAADAELVAMARARGAN